MRIIKLAQLNINSDEFKNWFSGSKVIDKNGNPLSVFHGTNQTINRFDKRLLGESTYASSAKEGFFFTENFEEATQYADFAAQQQVKDKLVFERKCREFERRIKNAERSGNWDLANKLTVEWEKFDHDSINDKSGQRVYHVYLSIKNPLIVDGFQLNNIGKVRDQILIAKKNGRDGLYIKGIQDGFHMPTNQWVAFDANQIKIISHD
jgi:hypothetical protein